jgi:purine nucleosidase
VTAPASALSIPVVIDTDAGADPDDAIALALACASPEIELLGVTTVDGDVGLRARIAARILGMAGRADVPVVPGLGWPLGPGRGPTMVGFEGRGLLDHPWQGPEATILDRPVPEWLIETSQRIPFQLVAIGPLANVAAACRLDPGFAGRLLGLTIMGGVYQERALPAAWQQSIRERGPVAWPDHNTASDPTAALICAQSGAAITWITSEVTHHLPFRQAGRDHLAEAGELGAALVRLIDVWYAEWFRPTLLDDSPAVPADAVALLHDPLTLASLFPQRADWLELRPARLRYDIEDGLFRLHEDAAGDLAMVSTGVAGERFAAFCLERIVRHASPT